MLSLKKVKGGKVAYIFEGEYAEIAVKLFPVISSKVIGIEPPADGVVKKERTLADVVTKVEKPMIQSLALSIPKTTAGVPSSLEELRIEARALIAELCSKDGLKYGQAWNKAYRILFDKTGFDVRKVSPVMVNGKPSLIETVLRDNRGQDLIRALRTYLDAA